MNPKKQKEKDRRRARKLAEEAWDAANVDNLDLAEKIIRRAVLAQSDNPVLWTDQGLLLGLRQKEAEAAESFRTALSLAPTFAEPYAYLAAQRIRQGFVREAVELQARAVKHAPENPFYAEQLEAYRSVAGHPTNEQTVATSARATAAAPDENWITRLDALAWEPIEERLTPDGCALIPKLVAPSICAALRSMFDDESLFAKTVVMDRPEFGIGTYRYFRSPIPAVVTHLRRAIFPHVARIANDWQQLLGEKERFPTEWDAFRDQCSNAGQSSSTPILLKYGPGGFNSLHRDLRGAVFFPIQMAVVLSPRAESSAEVGFRGGDFLFSDVPETKKARRQEIAAGLGDAVLFGTRDRLVRIGGVYGL